MVHSFELSGGRTLFAFDAAVILGLPFLASYVGGFSDNSFGHGLLAFVAAYGSATLYLLSVHGAYRVHLRYFDTADAMVVLRAVLIGTGAGCVASFVFDRMEGLARSVFLVSPLASLALLLLFRYAVQSFHRRGSPETVPWNAVTSVLVVGTNPIAALYIDAVHELGGSSCRVVGLLSERSSDTGHLIKGHKILGTVGDLPTLMVELRNHGIEVNCLAVALPDAAPVLQAALRELGQVEIIRLEQLADLLKIKKTTGPVTLQLERHRWSDGPWKRAIDVIVASAALVLLSPIVLFSMLLIFIEMGPPVIFWQERPGRFGVAFRLYKLRTIKLVRGGPAAPGAVRSHVAPICGLLRRLRLDEFPQLINVVLGHMSLVGPRPLLPIDQPKQFDDRLRLRPGITGWAQVNGGKLISPEEKALLDRWYAENASLSLDLKILLRTVVIMLCGDRVYRAATWNSVPLVPDIVQMRREDEHVFRTSSSDQELAGEQTIRDGGTSPLRPAAR